MPAQRPRVLCPAWPAPAAVGACFTTRQGGASGAPWAGLNLALHVGDDAQAVARNRAALASVLGPEVRVGWLEQMHGCAVAHLDTATAPAAADAAITHTRALACAVLVADCVPILLCAADASEVAAVHAGWRGLAAGVIARAVAAFAVHPGRLLAWIGPCIGAARYRVGDELRERFVAIEPRDAAWFHRHRGHWYCDLHGLSASRLEHAGVGAIYGTRRCVYREAAHFYSYRRDGVTGRMAGLIWIRPGP